MKKILILIVYFSLFITHYSFAQSGWFVKNYGGQIMSVSFLNQQTGFFGCVNCFLKTTNAGLSFQPCKSFTSVYKILYVNNNTGYLGGNRLYKTTSGGLDWFLLNTGSVQSSSNNFCFANENTGWLASDFEGKIFKTTNSGNNWFVISNNLVSINDFFFINELTGWFVRDYYTGYLPLNKTTNGGLNWITQQIDTNYSLFRNIYFADINTGYCMGGSNLLKTTNSGNQWFSVNSLNCNSMKFTNATTGWIIYSQSLKKTTNGGYNFFISDSTGNISLFDLTFVDNLTGWLVGYPGIIKKTTDFGFNWININNNNFLSGQTLSINKLNNNSAWIGIIKTTNRGDNWISFPTQFYHSVFSLNSSYYLNDSIGFISCLINNGPNMYNQTIYKTLNSGINWNLVLTVSNVPFSSVFNSFYFINNSTGWVAGTQGMIYKTSDSGNSWIVQSSGTSSILRTLKFINQSTGYCTSDNGSFLKTTNSGNTWNMFSTGFSNSLYGLTFVNENTGWTSGSGGIILKTTNSGLSWIQQNTNTGKLLYNIYFSDSSYGWACGQNGIILKTVNSGNYWRIDSDSLGFDLYNIYFFDRDEGLCYGSYGMVLKTTTGGASMINKYRDITPSSFSLSQNYPNPFNPATIIKFKIKDSKITTLRVFDLLGREVQTLVDEKLKPGEYEVTFDGSTLPSGVYIYKLTVGDFTDTKKLVLLK